MRRVGLCMHEELISLLPPCVLHKYGRCTIMWDSFARSLLSLAFHQGTQ